MPWYAIRTIYHLGAKGDGTNVFEERIVCFEGASWEEAHSKAEAESIAYANDADMVAHETQVGYEQDGEPLIDGYEVWSELFESRESFEEFYARRYTAYEHHPD